MPYLAVTWGIAAGHLHLDLVRLKVCGRYLVANAVAKLHMHFWGSDTEQPWRTQSTPRTVLSELALVCLTSRMRAVLTAVDSMVQRLFAAD